MLEVKKEENVLTTDSLRKIIAVMSQSGKKYAVKIRDLDSTSISVSHIFALSNPKTRTRIGKGLGGGKVYCTGVVPFSRRLTSE